jgi:hypothetical protein
MSKSAMLFRASKLFDFSVVVAGFGICRAPLTALSRGALGTSFKLLRILNLVEPDGIEPTTSCLQSTRSPN